MQGPALILFALFAVLLAGIYISIRRGWFPPGVTAAVGVVLSMLLMVLISLAQGNVLLQAILVGVLLGGVFSSVTIAAAWYFHSHELRGHYDEAAEPYPDEQTG